MTELIDCYLDQRSRASDRLTENIEGEGDPCQAEALEEAQCAEHGNVDGEGHGQTKHQHEQHRDDEHRMATKPTDTREGF